MSAVDDPRAWVQKAENDRIAIEIIVAAPRVPWDVVCFHTQQIAEKLLKALLVTHGRPPRRIHDLEALLNECLPFHPGLAELREDCARLTSYAAEARYPEEVGYELGEQEGRAMQDAALRVRERLMPLVTTAMRDS